MNLRPLIDDVAAQAADLLPSPRERGTARATLADFVALEYPRLALADRRLIVQHVLCHLDDEGLFPERFADAFDEASAFTEADDEA